MIFHCELIEQSFFIDVTFMKFHSLDAIDLALLDVLQDDASLSWQALGRRCGVSAPTALRRVRRLEAAGLIERRVAILRPQPHGGLPGQGLIAITEVALERQDDQALQAFEQQACADAAVQQCYRVSAGPDFVLVLALPDMAAYHRLAQQLFTAALQVRHVKTYFSVHRAKFTTRLPLPAPGGAAV